VKCIKTQTSKKEGKESTYNRKYERCMTGNSGVPNERECKRKKNDGEKTGIGWKGRKEGAECATRERESSTCGKNVAK
jgi:hypothetical protein